MKSVYCSWKDDEIKKLFKYVENCKTRNISLVKTFLEYAKANNRKPNSVRNYYYSEINELSNNSQKRSRLEIDLSHHTKIKQEPFSENEERLLIKEILKLTSLGHSVRNACLKLGEGDLEKMIRFQNKYRSVLRTNIELIESVSQELKREGFVVNIPKSANNENIIFMPKAKTSLTDDDIESLFRGLVRLVKRTAINQANEQCGKEVEFANDTLRKTLVKLSSKEIKVKELSLSNKKLIDENSKLTKRLEGLRCERKGLNRHNNVPKMEKLRKFLTASQEKNEKQEKVVER